MHQGTVCCPICSQEFEAHLIESHANTCLEKHLETETRKQIRKDEIVAEKLAKKLSSLKPGEEIDEQTLKEIERESQIQLERETGSIRKSLPPQQLENLDNIYLPIPQATHYPKSSAPTSVRDPQPRASPPVPPREKHVQLQKPLPPAPRDLSTPPPIPQRTYKPQPAVYLTPQQPYAQPPPSYPQQPPQYAQQPSQYTQQPPPQYPQQAPPQQPAPAPYRQVIPQSPLQAYIPAPQSYQQPPPQYAQQPSQYPQQPPPQYPQTTYQQAPSQYPYVQYQQVVYTNPPPTTPTNPYSVYQAYPGSPPPFYAPASSPYPATPQPSLVPLEPPPSETKTGVIKQGWIKVSIGSPNNFVKKWVVLHYKKFMLYENAAQNPTGISLEGCIVNEIDASTFQLCPPTSQVIHCTTETPFQCQEWIAALSQAEVAVVNKSSKSPTSPKGEINDGWILMTLKNGLNTVKNEVLTSQDAKKIDENFTAKLQQLQQNPQEENVVIHGHFVTILSNSAHKFGKDVPKFVQNWLKKAKRVLKSPTIEEDVFKELTSEVSMFIATELEAFEAHYPGLADISEESMHYCYVALESMLFPKINDELFLLFKKRFIADDANCMKKISSYRTIGPAHLGIPPEYWLVPQELDGRRSMEDVPYMKAISSLQQLSACDTPTKKFECLIRTAKNIIVSIQDYYAKHEHPDNKKVNTQLGADDLLPLFTYVVVKSNVPFIYSESKFMEQFITDKVAIEQGGYLAATLQTCLTFITNLSDKQLESTASELLDKVEKERQKQLERNDPVNSLAQQLASDVTLNTSNGPQETNLIEF